MSVVSCSIDFSLLSTASSKWTLLAVRLPREVTFTMSSVLLTVGAALMGVSGAGVSQIRPKSLTTESVAPFA